MRNPERIDKFCSELAEVWKSEACDLRFIQLVKCVCSKIPKDPFYVEEDEMMEYIKNYFKIK